MTVNWRWSLAVLGAVVVVLVGVEIVRKSVIIGRLETTLRATEAARLAAEDQVVAARRDARALRDEADGLQDEIARVRAAAGRVEIREVVRWRTGPATVTLPAGFRCPPGFEFRDGPGDPYCVGVVPPEGAPADGTGSPCGPGGAAVVPPCPEPRIELRGLEARLATKAGNLVAVGKVDVVRLDPPPEETVATLPWETGTLSVAEPPTTRIRWSLGPVVGVSAGKAVAGLLVTTPAARLGRLEVRPVLGAQANLDGDVAVQAGVLFGLRR